MFKPEVSQFLTEKFFSEVMGLEPMEYKRLVESGINVRSTMDACIKVANDVDKMLDDQVELWSGGCSTEACPREAAALILLQLLPKVVMYQAKVKISFFIEDMFKMLKRSPTGLIELAKRMAEDLAGDTATTRQ